MYDVFVGTFNYISPTVCVHIPCIYTFVHMFTYLRCVRAVNVCIPVANVSMPSAGM